VNVIKEIFGALGSTEIETTLVRELIADFNLPDRDYTGFVDAISEVKKKIHSGFVLF
jgi:hypothetical protein